jgi:hypothetical protein
VVQILTSPNRRPTLTFTFCLPSGRQAFYPPSDGQAFCPSEWTFVRADILTFSIGPSDARWFSRTTSLLSHLSHFSLTTSFISSLLVNKAEAKAKEIDIHHILAFFALGTLAGSRERCKVLPFSITFSPLSHPLTVSSYLSR